MTKYEIMYIVSTNISEEDTKKIVESFQKILVNNGAKIIENKDLGQKELAYEIKKQKSGHYFVTFVECENDQAIKEFDRLALINDKMIRHLITKEGK